MSEKKIHLKIITPEKIVFEDDVDSITAKGIKGSFGILPNHVPFMSALAVDTAKAVKDVNPEAKTIGGVICYHTLDFLNGALKTGMGEYLDFISFHEYPYNKCKLCRNSYYKYKP